MDFEQIENCINWHPVSREISQLVDSIKNLKPFFINEFIDEIIKNKDISALSLQDIETRGNEINDKIFMNEFTNQEENISEIINFTESLIKFLHKYNYYDYSTHKPSQDENIIYQLKKIDFLRNIYENINFELLKNSDLIRLLPCVIILDRIFNFSALIRNSFNTAVNRVLASNDFHLSQNNSNLFVDEKVILIKRNQKLLKNYIRYVILNYGNFTNLSNNISNGVFTNFEALLSKLVYLKDIITENGDLNEIMFLLTQNILHFNYTLEELEKLSKSQNKKVSKSQSKNLINLFKEFVCSYLNYTIMATFKEGNSVKNIDSIILTKFTGALILLKKSEYENFERNQLKNDINYNETLKDFVDKYLFKTVFSKQSLLSNFIVKGDGILNLIELDSLFEVKNFDSKISLGMLRDYCSDLVIIKDANSILDFVKYAAGKYQVSNINIM